ncbi:MAG TPA: molybdate ABC transporter substrate-binding protein [Thermoanaerobaculia bacterium]|nr:molybdate ABC transporter substrate-binding protein [Thermoanaerobaculia bacterium]
MARALLIVVLLLAPAFRHSAVPPPSAPPPAARGEIVVAAAASLGDAMRQIALAWEAAGGARVRLNLAGSNVLAEQIARGAPAEVFVSADEARMDALERRGMLLPGARRRLLSNSLVIVVPRDSGVRISAPRDLAGTEIRRLALGDPEAVPAGLYAKAWLEEAGVWAAVRDRILPAADVRAALAAVEAGAADAAVVYRTDALGRGRARVAYEAAPGEGPPISYAAAAIRSAPDPAEARRFLEFLASAQARTIFERHGFTP